MKFSNRKIASAAIGNRRKLRKFDEARQKKGKDKIYLRNSLCPPFAYLMFLCREAFRKRKIAGFWLAGDVIKIKMGPNSPPERVNHINDMVSLGLATEGDVVTFYS